MVMVSSVTSTILSGVCLFPMNVPSDQEAQKAVQSGGVNPFLYSQTKLLQSDLVQLSNVFQFKNRNTVHQFYCLPKESVSAENASVD